MNRIYQLMLINGTPVDVVARAAELVADWILDNGYMFADGTTLEIETNE